jgi:hypothetical protein
VQRNHHHLREHTILAFNVPIQKQEKHQRTWQKPLITTIRKSSLCQVYWMHAVGSLTSLPWVSVMRQRSLLWSMHRFTDQGQQGDTIIAAVDV